MPTFCRVLAGLLAAESLAWVVYAASELRQFPDPSLVILALIWVPAVVLAGLRAGGVRFGGPRWMPWVAVLAPAAGSLAWVTWQVADMGIANTQTSGFVMIGVWVGALVGGLIGLALDRPGFATQADD